MDLEILNGNKNMLLGLRRFIAFSPSVHQMCHLQDVIHVINFHGRVQGPHLYLWGSISGFLGVPFYGFGGCWSSLPIGTKIYQPATFMFALNFSTKKVESL
jgi:hypothetical protein